MSIPLTGRLLVATPLLSDPSFHRAVVLVLDHDEDGTLGVLVNRPTELEVERVLPGWGEHTGGLDVVFEGGPVATDSAVAVAAMVGEDEPLGFRRVTRRLGLVDLDTPPEVVVPELAALRIFAGYAGWGPEQLDGELAEGAWYVVDAEPDDPFSTAPGHLWRSVLRRQGGDLALVATFPDDPSMN